MKETQYSITRKIPFLFESRVSKNKRGSITLVMVFTFLVETEKYGYLKQSNTFRGKNYTMESKNKKEKEKKKTEGKK